MTRYTTSYSNDYRFGFNGMEKDNEVKGIGNSLDFGARIYDSRLGKWLSPDPYEFKYPKFSPYNFAMDNPIAFIDPDGNVVYLSVGQHGEAGAAFCKIVGGVFNEQVTVTHDDNFNLILVRKEGAVFDEDQKVLFNKLTEMINSTDKVYSFDLKTYTPTFGEPEGWSGDLYLKILESLPNDRGPWARIERLTHYVIEQYNKKQNGHTAKWNTNEGQDQYHIDHDKTVLEYGYEKSGSLYSNPNDDDGNMNVDIMADFTDVNGNYAGTIRQTGNDVDGFKIERISPERRGLRIGDKLTESNKLNKSTYESILQKE